MKLLSKKNKRYQIEVSEDELGAVFASVMLCAVKLSIEPQRSMCKNIGLTLAGYRKEADNYECSNVN